MQELLHMPSGQFSQVFKKVEELRLQNVSTSYQQQQGLSPKGGLQSTDPSLLVSTGLSQDLAEIMPLRDQSLGIDDRERSIALIQDRVKESLQYTKGVTPAHMYEAANAATRNTAGHSTEAIAKSANQSGVNLAYAAVDELRATLQDIVKMGDQAINTTDISLTLAAALPMKPPEQQQDNGFVRDRSSTS
jgi:hypothetical protein